jgi:hypothetical protein
VRLNTELHHFVVVVGRAELGRFSNEDCALVSLNFLLRRTAYDTANGHVLDCKRGLTLSRFGYVVAANNGPPLRQPTTQ